MADVDAEDRVGPRFAFVLEGVFWKLEPKNGD
jgi:hypothetical protein